MKTLSFLVFLSMWGLSGTAQNYINESTDPNDEIGDVGIITISGSSLTPGNPIPDAISGGLNRAGTVVFPPPVTFPHDSVDIWHLPDTADWPFHQDLSGVLTLEQFYDGTITRDYVIELREYMTSARTTVEFAIPLSLTQGTSIPNLNRDRYYSLVFTYQDNGITNPSPTELFGYYSIQFSLTAGADQGSGSIGLPVEWLSFEAELKEQLIHLSWSTAAEENNRGFYIERSADATHWEELGFVEGAGTTEEIRQYSFIDRTPSLGYNYYRIRQEDYNGDTDYSAIRETILDPGVFADALKLFPNPVTDLLNVSPFIGTYRVLDLQGRVLASSQLNGNWAQISMTSLPMGVYLLELTGTEQSVQIHRIVKR